MISRHNPGVLVVADTTPLNYLILIQEADLLPTLFGRIFIPQGVADELRHQRAPDAVRQWMLQPPSWLAVESAQPLSIAVLAQLDRGEREAIELALQKSWTSPGGVLLLMDEARGRQTAVAHQLPIRGTIGVLQQAARSGLVNLAIALGKLEKTTFRLSPALRAAALGQGQAKMGR